MWVASHLRTFQVEFTHPLSELVRAALFGQSSTTSLCPRISHVGSFLPQIISLQKLTNERRWHSQLVLENVSMRLAYVLPQLIRSGSFEVQMGIIASCAPTLRPGWRWLYDRMKGHSPHKGHALLTDEVQLRPYDGGGPTSVSRLTSKHNNRATDLEFRDTFQPPLPLIQKTTRVDVDVDDTPQGLREL